MHFSTCKQIPTERTFKFGKYLLVWDCSSPLVIVDHLLFLVDALQYTDDDDKLYKLYLDTFGRKNPYLQ